MRACHPHAMLSRQMQQAIDSRSAEAELAINYKGLLPVPSCQCSSTTPPWSCPGEAGPSMCLGTQPYGAPAQLLKFRSLPKGHSGVAKRACLQGHLAQ